jgi:class 3 adenylate cyclase
MGDTKSPILSQSFSPEPRDSTYAASLFIQFSTVIVLLILSVLLFTTFFFMKKQEALLFQEKVNTREMTLNHYAHQAVSPLLENDVLNLNILMKEAKEGRGLLYGMIVDNQQIIKAHTDPTKIGLEFLGLENAEPLAKGEKTVSSTYLHPSGTHVLDLSQRILFVNKGLGTIHLGFSLDLINNEIKRETYSWLKTLLLFNLIIFMIGLAVILFFIWRVKRPSSEWILSHREGRGGEKIPGWENALTSRTAQDQATIIYAGIKDLAAYDNIQEPERILEDINECLSIVTFNILKNGGYIAKIIGDSVIGVFRSSPLEKDHTVRAIRSAEGIQESLKNAKDGSRNQLLGKVGIGITSGVILSGHTHSTIEKKYDFIGEIFKLTQSLYMMAAPGEIVMSKDVYQAVENLVTVDPLPPLEIVQKREAWENFRLRGLVEKRKYD